MVRHASRRECISADQILRRLSACPDTQERLQETRNLLSDQMEQLVEFMHTLLNLQGGEDYKRLLQIMTDTTDEAQRKPVQSLDQMASRNPNVARLITLIEPYVKPYMQPSQNESDQQYTTTDIVLAARYALTQGTNGSAATFVSWMVQDHPSQEALSVYIEQLLKEHPQEARRFFADMEYYLGRTMKVHPKIDMLCEWERFFKNRLASNAQLQHETH